MSKVMLFALLLVGTAQAAVTTAQHASYAFRPCSTCREVAFPTEQECRAAAQAEAQRVGQTRTTGSAVYTCITRFNVIATFRPNPVTGSATLSWTPPTQNTNGSALTNLAGYRIRYGTTSTNLDQQIEVATPGLTGHTVANLAPGTYYFAVLAYSTTGVESSLSNIASKVIT